MSNKSINQIKKELRFIKKANIAIDTYMDTQAKFQRRLDWLKTQKQSPKVLKDLEGTQKVLNALKQTVNIDRLSNLEEFYLTNIGKLDDEYDKLVLIKVYIQGQTFDKVSRQLCYSIDGLKDRAKRAINKLRNAINKG